MIFDRQKNKNVDQSSNKNTFDFLDKANVGNHSRGLESENENREERQRGWDRDFARCFVFNSLIFDRQKKKNVDFSSKDAQKIDFQTK